MPSMAEKYVSQTSRFGPIRMERYNDGSGRMWLEGEGIDPNVWIWTWSPFGPYHGLEELAKAAALISGNFEVRRHAPH